MVSTSPASCVRIDSSRVISSRRWRSVSSVTDWARASASPSTLRARSSASATMHAGLGLGFGLGLVDELLGQQQRALQVCRR